MRAHHDIVVMAPLVLEAMCSSSGVGSKPAGVELEIPVMLPAFRRSEFKGGGGGGGS